MKEIPVIEDLLPLKNLLFDIDIVHGNSNEELTGSSVHKY